MARHFSMLRDMHLADAFTLANAACGVAAIFCAMIYLDSGSLAYLFVSAALAPAAFVFDVLDGRIARWRHSHSALGRELDSLADVISFGVAPAALGFAAGLTGGWDALILIYFVCCGVSRLARYNVTAETLSGATPRYLTSKARRSRPASCSPLFWHLRRGRAESVSRSTGACGRSDPGNCIRSCCCSGSPAR